LTFLPCSWDLRQDVGRRLSPIDLAESFTVARARRIAAFAQTLDIRQNYEPNATWGWNVKGLT